MPTPTKDYAPTTVYIPQAGFVQWFVISGSGYPYLMPLESMPETYSVGDVTPNIHRPAYSLLQYDISDNLPHTAVLLVKGKIRMDTEAGAKTERQALKLQVRNAKWFGSDAGVIETLVGRNGIKFTAGQADKIMGICDFVATFVPKKVEDLDTLLGGWF